MVADQRAFDEAILLARTRLKLPDPDLKHGTVEKITITTSTASYERPWSINGSFATVYKFRTRDGKYKALRCFRAAMKPEIQDRYVMLGDYFAAEAPGITAGFHYYDDCLSIDEVIGGVKKRVTHPVLLMDWIDGATVLEKVDELCKRRDREGLAHLCEQWLILLHAKRRARIGHGDLSAENVMVRGDGRLVLVDYDGVYIPPFHGLAPLVSGQPHYQHPDMHHRPFDEHMDDFSGYVVFIALRALQSRPQLWDQFAPKGMSSKLLEANLLFTHEDFLHPEQSKLFAELAHIPDPLLQYAVQALLDACAQPIEQVRFPPLDDDYRAITTTFPASTVASSQEQRTRLHLELLRYSIHHQMTRDTIVFAQELERVMPEPLAEKTLRDAVHAAKQQFIEQFRPQDITVQTDRLGKVFVRWQWPAEELVQFAVVAWRSDRSPHHAEESGTYLYQPLSKQRYQQSGCFQFQVPQLAAIYLQVYFAMPDHVTASRRMTWVYSKGNEHAQVIRRRTSVLNAY